MTSPLDERREKESGIYFVQPEAGGLIKIGWSSDIRERLRDIQCMCPIQLVLLGTIPGATLAFERELHGRFSEWRRHGEWFEPTDALEALARGRNDRFLRHVTRGEAAAVLGVSEAFVSSELAPIIVATGPRGGGRLIEDDLNELAVRVSAERVRRAVRAGLKAAQAQIAQIAEEAALLVEREAG